MMSKSKFLLAAGLIAGALELGAAPAVALPMATTVAPAAAPVAVDQVYYRCGYYGCRRRFGYRRFYRPYRYYGYGYGYRRPFVRFGFY